MREENKEEMENRKYNNKIPKTDIKITLYIIIHHGRDK